MLGYLGLPLLWKRPTDHFDNSTARTHFWGLLTYLVHRSDVVLASNNPILAEQIAFQSKGEQSFQWFVLMRGLLRLLMHLLS